MSQLAVVSTLNVTPDGAQKADASITAKVSALMQGQNGGAFTSFFEQLTKGVPNFGGTVQGTFGSTPAVPMQATTTAVAQKMPTEVTLVPDEQGLSTGTKIAIGVGLAAVVAGGLYWLSKR